MRTPEQQRQVPPEREQEAPPNPESPEYREWLRRKTARLEVELTTMAGKSSLVETLPDLRQGASVLGTEWYERYSELVTARLELFLLSPEEKRALEEEYAKVEGTFDPAINKKLQEMLALFEFGKPKKGIPTSKLLMKYQGKDRIWTGRVNEHVQELEQLITIATPQQQAFLQHLKATLIAIMEMDPIAKKELEIRQQATPKGWSKTGIAARAVGLVAVSALALFSFIANKFKLGYTTAAYAGAAYLLANGFPKGKVAKIVDQCTTLRERIAAFEVSMGPQHRKIEAEYFRTDPLGWRELTSNLMSPAGKRMFRQMERTLRNKKKTPEEQNEAETQFLQDIAGNDQITAHRQFRGMQREERMHLCRIFLQVSDSGAQEATRQYFENLSGPQELPPAAMPPQPAPPPPAGTTPRAI
ncbi:MAG: hypothetical protein PHU04_03885 [Candidatus Peribacteraceae bacterium]|nr:hypothetical protein [Candidatus Peribacteraceae bacterium]